MKVIPRTHVEGQKGYSDYDAVNAEHAKVVAALPAPPVVVPPVFVLKISGETYDSYVARAQVAGATLVDQAAWELLPAG